MKNKNKPLIQQFFKYIIPSLIAQWVYALYTMVDGMFVARGVSELALSGINIASPFVTLLFSISLMFSVGSATLMGIMIGQNKTKEASMVFTQSMVSLLLISIFITLFVLSNSSHIAYFLGATQNNIQYVESYLRNIAIFNIFFIASYSFEVMIKTDGFPMGATIYSAVGVTLNCILDYFFVIRWNWGVSGAAIATGLAQMTVTIFHLIHFIGPKGTLRFTPFRFQLATLTATIKNGFSSALTEMSPGIVIFLFNHYILKYLSEDAIVSYSIVSYVNTILIMSMLGVTQGMQPLISKHYGKQEYATCTKLLKYGLYFSSAYGVLYFIGSRVFAPHLVNIFIGSELPLLRTSSTSIFLSFSWAFLLCGFNIITSGYFTSIDKPFPALMISLSRGLLFILVLLPIICNSFGGQGIWYVVTIAESICLILSIILVLRSKKL